MRFKPGDYAFLNAIAVQESNKQSLDQVANDTWVRLWQVRIQPEFNFQAPVTEQLWER